MIDLSRYSIQPLEASHSVHTATNIAWNALLSIDDDHRVISHTSTVIKRTLAHKSAEKGTKFEKLQFIQSLVAVGYISANIYQNKKTLKILNCKSKRKSYLLQLKSDGWPQ